MCNKITKVSSLGQFQWIGVCSHGAAHIFWKATQISFSKKELEQLIDSAFLDNLPLEEYGGVQLLWINHVAIKLNKIDAREMQTLFSNAHKGTRHTFTQARQNAENRDYILH